MLLLAYQITKFWLLWNLRRLALAMEKLEGWTTEAHFQEGVIKSLWPEIVWSKVFVRHHLFIPASLANCHLSIYIILYNNNYFKELITMLKSVLYCLPWHVLLISPYHMQHFKTVCRRKLFIAPKWDAKTNSPLCIQFPAANFSWYSHVSMETHNTLDALSFVPERGHCQVFPSNELNCLHLF